MSIYLLKNPEIHLVTLEMVINFTSITTYSISQVEVHTQDKLSTIGTRWQC